MKGFAICCLIGTIVMIILHIAQDLTYIPSYVPQFTEEEMEQICIEEGIE